jgi:NifU-like protein involved in Fe-S cluster formation
MEHNDTSDSRAKIMEHYANPQFKGFKNQGEKYEAQSPTCSDRIQLEIASENDIVTHIAFEGEGCAVSLASSDTFCQTIQGKSKAVIQQIIVEYKKCCWENRLMPTFWGNSSFSRMSEPKNRALPVLQLLLTFWVFS